MRLLTLGWRAAFVAAVVAGAGVALLASSSSCAYTIADGICRASSAIGSEDAGACVDCMQRTPDCCDQVGRCGEQGDCIERVRNTQRCIAEAGPYRAAIEEESCKNALGLDASDTTTARARSTYACMRTNCGPACSLPTCKLDPAAGEFVNATCDRCVSLSCCNEVNACYGNRACKLTLECIVRKCGDGLGAALTANATNAPIFTTACSAGSSMRPPDPVLPNNCIGDCIAQYATSSVESSDTPPEQTIRCVATRVFACAAQAGCAAACVPEPNVDAGMDASDGGVDASADAADAASE